MNKNFKRFTIIISSLIVSVLFVSNFVLGAFPASPSDNDVYVKDGVRYIYSLSSNSWTKQADPDKSAGNIKNGTEIDGVTGTFPDDGTSAVGDVLSGKTFYSSTANKLTGTMANKVSSATVFTPSTSDQAITQGYYGGAAGDGKVLGDADLAAANIKNGADIFGVTGTYDYEATNPILATDVVAPHVGFVNGSKITGTVTEKVGSATVLTPSTSDQAFPAGRYGGSTSDGKVSGDADLSAANIKSGVGLFGVTGTFPSDGDAAVGEVLTGKYFYSNDATKRTGTMTNVGAQSITPTAAGVTITAGYHNGSGGTVADADLVAGNIKSGVNIFGVAGSYAGPSLEAETYALDGTFRIYYRKVGKVYILGNPYDPNTFKYGFRSDETTRGRIATALGITIADYYEGPAMSTYRSYYNSGWTTRSATEASLWAVVAN